MVTGMFYLYFYFSSSQTLKVVLCCSLRAKLQHCIIHELPLCHPPAEHPEWLSVRSYSCQLHNAVPWLKKTKTKPICVRTHSVTPPLTPSAVELLSSYLPASYVHMRLTFRGKSWREQWSQRLLPKQPQGSPDGCGFRAFFCL